MVLNEILGNTKLYLALIFHTHYNELQQKTTFLSIKRISYGNVRRMPRGTQDRCPRFGEKACRNILQFGICVSQADQQCGEMRGDGK